jgi:hypothetical protein
LFRLDQGRIIRETSLQFDSEYQKNRGYIPLTEREVVEDTHEPIVSKEDWQRVQEIMDRHNRVVPSKCGYENIFRGLLECADCGSALSVHTDARKKGEPRDMVYFICVKYRHDGSNYCTNHRVDASVLEDTVLADIRRQVAKAVKNPERFAREVLDGYGKKSAEDAAKRERQVAKLEKELADADARYIKCFEDYTDGTIDKQQFSLLSAHYSEKQQDAKARIEDLRSLAEKEKAAHSDGEQFIADLVGYAEVEHLDAAMLNRLISKIVIHQPLVKDSKREQRIDITYRCAGKLR